MQDARILVVEDEPTVAQEIRIHLLRISEPTLEDVFIKLVGRGLSIDTTVSASGEGQ